MSHYKTVSLDAFSRDCNVITVSTEVGTCYEASGYALSGICLGPGGDYIRIEVDIETGQIIGWDPEKVKEQIQEYINDDVLERE